MTGDIAGLKGLEQWITFVHQNNASYVMPLFVASTTIQSQQTKQEGSRELRDPSSEHSATAWDQQVRLSCISEHERVTDFM